MAKTPRRKSPDRKTSPDAKASTKSERSATSTESPKELLDRFRHEMHLLEAQLKRLESDAPNLPDSSRRKVRALRDRVKHLEAEAAKHPELVQVLGLEEPLPTQPAAIEAVVPEAKFETFEVKVEESRRFASAPLPVDWPRSGQTIVGENRLGDVETVGKVRVQLKLDDGQPVRGAEFRVVAKAMESGDRIVLRSAHTNSLGYAAVKLNGVLVADIGELSIEVGAESAGEDKESKGHRFNIHDAHITTHRDLGIAHNLRISSPMVGMVGESAENGETSATGESPEEGTIEDPDPSDVRNSPDSFGLNEVEEDGNCCLRPQKELASRQYFFRQIVRITPPPLVVGWPPLKLPETLKGRAPIRAPIPFGGESPGDYAVRGGGPLLGFANLYSHSWYPKGRGLGELLYSLALAPCEQINLAFIDWTRSQVDTRREFTAASERFEHELNHDRSISEVVDAVLEEEQSGSSTAGGGGASLDLGVFSIGGGGGHTTSSSSGRREIQASTVQEISDSVVQRGSALRSLRSTVVTTSVQRESERIRTRTVHNHNRNHAMTVQYFQVLSHYSVKTELVEEKPVLLIPYEIDHDIFDKIPSFKKFVLSPSRPITRFLDRHRRLLMVLLPRRFRRGFEALSRLLHCSDVYEIEQPFATVSHWRITLDDAWRDSVTFTVETNDGQSYPLRPRGRSGGGSTTEFSSDPVKVSSIQALGVSFDHVRAAEGMGGLANLFGGAFEDLLEKSVNHVLERAEIHIRTDRSRFVPEPQSYRMVVAVNPKVTLSASNPFTSLGLTPPNVSFEGYRGREHKDYCLLKELIAHIQAHPMRYLRALWYREDPDRRAMRFDRYVFQGRPLLDEIMNRPVGVVGNYVAFPLLNGHRLVPATKPNHVVDERLISLPTRGVFAEVFLSCCNATEKRDVERVIDPENACAIQAPDITGVQPGSRRERRDLQPTDFPSPIVNLQNAPNVPDPTGLASALNVLKTPDIFRDLTRGAELLQFIDNATKEAFTSTRAHRAAMDKLAGDVLKAYLGIPPASGSGGKAPASGTTGIKPAESGGGSAGPAGQTLAETVSSEQVRQTSPQRLSDHGKVLRQFVDDNLITPEQGNERANALFGGSIMPASFIPPGPVATAVATQIQDFQLHVENIRNGVSAHALLELTFWQNAGTQLVESDPTVAGKLEDYARAAGVPNPAATAANFAATGRSPPGPPPHEEPWSAAFISYIMEQAGAASGQFGAFHLNRGHDEYIKAARDNREAQDIMNPFWLTTLDEVAPEIGDLLCLNRGGGTVSFDPTVAGGNLPADFRSHTDVVTGISVNASGDPVLVTLGGNLGHSVRERFVPVDANFKVTANSHNGVEPAARRPADPYFAILRMRRSIFETYPGP